MRPEYVLGCYLGAPVFGAAIGFVVSTIALTIFGPRGVVDRCSMTRNPAVSSDIEEASGEGAVRGSRWTTVRIELEREKNESGLETTLHIYNEI